MPLIHDSSYRAPLLAPRRPCANDLSRPVPAGDARAAARAERLELPDGDFIDLEWAGNASPRLAILSHGLEADIENRLHPRHGRRADPPGLGRAGLEFPRLRRRAEPPAAHVSQRCDRGSARGRLPCAGEPSGGLHRSRRLQPRWKSNARSTSASVLRNSRRGSTGRWPSPCPAISPARRGSSRLLPTGFTWTGSSSRCGRRSARRNPCFPINSI